MSGSKTLTIAIHFDLICPWCFIGKRGLDQAIEILSGQGVEVDVEWLPYQLNPTMPVEGMDRKAFRTMRFGWENSLAMDARAVEAGRKVGADFRYDLQSRTPNTLAAHALVRLARVEGGAVMQQRVAGALFAAYFSLGQDIGDERVLDRIANEAGLASGAVDRSVAARDEVGRLDERIRSMGINGVPSFIVDGRLLFNGSQTVATYVDGLARVAQAA